MNQLKERNYRYDALRGLCMFLVVVQHFTFKGGYHFTDPTGNLIYVGIDIFVMQTFFCLSGFFSKNPDKNRESLFRHLLWPVIVVGMFFWPLLAWRHGLDAAEIRFRSGSLPYAMWFLVVLFVYKYFQKYYVKIHHLLPAALILYLASGIFEPLSSTGFALSRMCTFFISFVIGYMLTMEKAEQLRLRKVWQIALLGSVLIAISVLVVYCFPHNYADAIKLKFSFARTDMLIWEGILVRLGILAVSTGWILFLFSIMPSRKGILAHIGMNTMPVYIFHLFLAGVFRVHGFTFGFFDFKDNKGVYLICLFVISVIVTLVLSSKPFQKLYDLIIDGTYKLVSSAFCKMLAPVRTPLSKVEIQSNVKGPSS